MGIPVCVQTSYESLPILGRVLARFPGHPDVLYQKSILLEKAGRPLHFDLEIDRQTFEDLIAARVASLVVVAGEATPTA